MKEDNRPTDNSYYRAKLFVPTTFPSHQEVTDDGLRSVYFHGRIATAVASKIGARLWERLSNSLTLNQGVLSSGSWRKLAFLAFSCLKSVLWIDKFERVLNIITMVALFRVWRMRYLDNIPQRNFRVEEDSASLLFEETSKFGKRVWKEVEIK